MYDALMREFSGGNRQACDLDEVREWCMRNIESVNKLLFSIQNSRGIDVNFDLETQ